MNKTHTVAAAIGKSRPAPNVVPSNLAASMIILASATLRRNKLGHPQFVRRPPLSCRASMTSPLVREAVGYAHGFNCGLPLPTPPEQAQQAEAGEVDYG
jgi:hypothetical protein